MKNRGSAWQPIPLPRRSKPEAAARPILKQQGSYSWGRQLIGDESGEANGEPGVAVGGLKTFPLPRKASREARPGSFFPIRRLVSFGERVAQAIHLVEKHVVVSFYKAEVRQPIPSSRSIERVEVLPFSPIHDPTHDPFGNFGVDVEFRHGKKLACIPEILQINQVTDTLYLLQPEFRRLWQQGLQIAGEGSHLLPNDKTFSPMCRGPFQVVETLSNLRKSPSSVAKRTPRRKLVGSFVNLASPSKRASSRPGTRRPSKLLTRRRRTRLPAKSFAVIRLRSGSGL